MTIEDTDKYIDRMSFVEVYDIGKYVSVISFNRGHSHFIYADNCYILINGGHVSYWLFEEAVEVLKDLPSPKEMGKLVNKFMKMRAFA